MGGQTLDELSEVTDGESPVLALLTVRVLDGDQLLVSIDKTVIRCQSARVFLPLAK